MLKQTLGAMRDLPRVRDIAGIFIRHGLGEFISRLRLSGDRRPRHADVEHKKSYFTTAQRFRLAFEELGPTFIKLGQVLSTRVDMFPPDWIKEFQHLQDEVRPIPPEDIRAVVTASLGRPMEEVFEVFEWIPVGSASIAQVHRAVLKNGALVAVKVKRPGIEATIAADLRILTYLAGLIESEMPEIRRYQPVNMVQYFARSLERETDLTFEMRNLQRFQGAFVDNSLVHVPRVYADLSDRNVLVQSFVGGTLLKQFNPSTATPATREILATRIADAVLHMILKEGFFHADPHPGNIFIQGDNEITFIDFGLVGSLSNTRRRELITLINSLIERDQFTLQYMLSNWAQGELPDENLLGTDVMEMLLNYEHVALKNLNISQVINDITQIMRTHGLTLPPDLVMLFKALITLEGVVKNLSGDFQLLEHTKPLVIAVLRKNISPGHVGRKAKMHSQTLLQVLDEMPHNIMRLSRRIRTGQFKVNLEVGRLEELIQQLDRVANRLTMGIVTAALIIGSSIVMQIRGGPMIFGFSLFGFIGYVLAFINSLWIIWSIWRSGRN